MYKITVQTLTGNEHTIYVPGNEDYVVTSAVLSLSVGSVGEFNFTVPLSNPRYNEIVDHSIITVYEDTAEIWRGEIRDIKQNFDKSLNVYCLEDMAWLGECAVAMTSITNQTYGQRFSAAIATYNTNQVAKRQFTAGILTSITTTDMCTWQPQYEEDLLTCLRNYIADDGYVRIRREYSGGVLTRYVDIVKLSDYGEQGDQKIEFGSNLLDFVKEMDDTNFLNVIYPYGKETETPLYGEIMQRTVGTPQENAASIAAFGRRERSVIFETDSIAKLNSLAQSYLNRYSQPSMKIEVKAVDLGNIEVVNRIHLGDSVRIIANTFGIDQWSYATKQELNLLNIADNQITLADAVRVQSLTSQVIEQAQEIKDAQTPASVLDEAKRNAWAIFEGDNGGIVTFDVNGNEQIVGIHIANNLDLSQATKAWGWNINGLVYLHRTYPSDNWTVGIAMTMDGQIVADYITTGEMSADRINGGHIRANLITALNGSTTVGANTLNDFATDSDISDAVSDYDSTLNQAKVFNKLTNNGEVQGIYLNNDKVYINASYIQAGDLSANRIKGGQLTLGDDSTAWTRLVVNDSNGNYLGGINDAWYVNELYVYGQDNPYGWNDIPLLRGGDGWRTVAVTNTATSRTFTYAYRPYIAGQMNDIEKQEDLGGGYYEISYIMTLLDANGDEVDYFLTFGSSQLKYRDAVHTTPLSFGYTDIQNSYGQWQGLYESTSAEIDKIPKNFGRESSEYIQITLTVDNMQTLYNQGVRRLRFNFGYVGFATGVREDGIYGSHRGTFNGYANIYDSAANLLVDAASREMHLVSDVDNKIDIAYDDITQTVSGTAKHPIWSASDERVKEDIEPLDVDLSKNLIDATKPKRFKFKNTDGIHYGVTAQDMREILDSIGETESELEHSMGLPEEKTGLVDERMVEYLEFIPHLINYVKDLRAEVVALKNIINTLKED